MPVYQPPLAPGGTYTVGTLQVDSIQGRVNVVAYAAAVTLDLSVRNDFEIYLTGNIEISFSGLNPGRQGTVWVMQDDTGSRTVTFKQPTGYGILGDAFADLTAQTSPRAITGYSYYVIAANGRPQVRIAPIPLRLISYPLDRLAALPTVAWSVNERLFASYSGPLFKVRRSSDSTTTDIYPIAETGVYDEASIIAFCGQGSGYVTTLYDQSGSALNLTQATEARQPLIYSSGALQKNGSNVVMVFNGTSHFLERADAMGFSGNAAFTTAFLYAPTVNAGARAALLTGSTTANLLSVGTVNSQPRVDGSSPALRVFTGAPAAAYRHELFFHAASAAVSATTCRVNGVALGAGTSGAGNFALVGTNPTYVGSSLTDYTAMSVSTMFMWASVLAGADITLLETVLEQRRVG